MDGPVSAFDGKSTHPSSGDVIDTKRKKIMANLIESAKLLEIQLESGKVEPVGTR